jgi:nucleoside 2-deoxyribosyltransferase
LSGEKIYIAGSSNEIPLIQGFMEAARDYGYEVTYDWTTNELWSHSEPSDAALAICAQVDENAVREADILWYITPAEASGKSEGSHYELGFARGLGKIILVSGTLGRHRIFPRLSPLRFSMHSEALECLRTRAWDTSEFDLLRALSQADSVTIPAAHLGMQRAARALEMEGKVSVKVIAGSFVVTRVKAENQETR